VKLKWKPHFLSDCSGYRFGILQNIVVSETNNFPALALQIALPLQIIFVDVVVVPAVQVHNDALNFAGEICEKLIFRYLGLIATGARGGWRRVGGG